MGFRSPMEAKGQKNAMTQLLHILTIMLAAEFGGADTYTWITLFLVPVSSIVTWFASRRVRNNSTLQQMQETIDMLVKKNSDLYAEIAELNRQLTEVRKENAELIAGQARISEENAELKRQFEVRTFPTKKKQRKQRDTGGIPNIVAKEE